VRTVAWSGIVEPATGTPQIAGIMIVAIGTAIALWCVFTFVFIEKDTPTPFDRPPQIIPDSEGPNSRAINHHG
jgi:hypothetical protein